MKTSLFTLLCLLITACTPAAEPVRANGEAAYAYDGTFIYLAARGGLYSAESDLVGHNISLDLPECPTSAPMPEVCTLLGTSGQTVISVTASQRRDEVLRIRKLTGAIRGGQATIQRHEENQAYYVELIPNVPDWLNE